MVATLAAGDSENHRAGDDPRSTSASISDAVDDIEIETRQAGNTAIYPIAAQAERRNVVDHLDNTGDVVVCFDQRHSSTAERTPSKSTYEEFRHGV